MAKSKISPSGDEDPETWIRFELTKKEAERLKGYKILDQAFRDLIGTKSPWGAFIPARHGGPNGAGLFQCGCEFGYNLRLEQTFGILSGHINNPYQNEYFEDYWRKIVKGIKGLTVEATLEATNRSFLKKVHEDEQTESYDTIAMAMIKGITLSRADEAYANRAGAEKPIFMENMSAYVYNPTEERVTEAAKQFRGLLDCMESHQHMFYEIGTLLSYARKIGEFSETSAIHTTRMAEKCSSEALTAAQKEFDILQRPDFTGLAGLLCNTRK